MGVRTPGKHMRPLEGHTEGSTGKYLHMGGLRQVPSVTALTNMGQEAWARTSVLGVRQARPTTTELHQSGKRRTQWALRGPHAGTLPMVKTACWKPLDRRASVRTQLHQPPPRRKSLRVYGAVSGSAVLLLMAVPRGLTSVVRLHQARQRPDGKLGPRCGRNPDHMYIGMRPTNSI